MVRPRILFIEDEDDLAEPVCEGLKREGFEIFHALTGEEARRLLDDSFDLVILDLMLPDIPGEQILNYLKGLPDYPPVLVLTAKSSHADKLALFRQGCDDYLTKPFLFDELLERAKALLRRTKRVIAPASRFGDLVLDPEMHTLSSPAGTVLLTPKESAIVRMVMSEAGRVVSRKEILHGVWGLKTEPSTNFIGVHIFNLRKKFARIGREECFRTVRGTGFTLLPDSSSAVVVA